ncbi:MAG: response regulator transcription factor [Bacteroidetes bacterium]|nr:response regulator transcription factor [Bacteroidota bacterium]
MKFIIIDDDPTCITTLEKIIAEYCPQLQLSGTANTIEDSVRLINSTQPDLVLLDVEIHGNLGFELFNYFPNPDFEVVFTTAHEKYALQAIKRSCYDYLLKPISIPEIVAITSKLEAEQKSRSEEHIRVLLNNLEPSGHQRHKIAIPSPTGYVFVQIEEIVLFEGDGKYTKITTADGNRYLSTKNIGEFESLLPAERFFRTHKSWLVNLLFVKNYDKSSSRLYLNGNLTAEVSIRKRDDFLKLFERV